MRFSVPVTAGELPAIYQGDPERAPDGDFEPGAVAHAVVGNEGRMLDPRRTPIRVVGVRPATGHAVLEVLAFEDAGARWEIELEHLDRFQFSKTSVRAGTAVFEELTDAVHRLDRPLEITADPAARERTGGLVSAERVAARSWLRGRRVRIDLGSRTSDVATRELLSAFLAERGLAEMEEAFAERYVSNPGAGELVKGHRIVIAELGLAPYVGKIPRDPDLLTGGWSPGRRAKHIIARLAFVPELFRVAGHEVVTLWRGLSSERPLERLALQTFVSTTFSREVAQSHFEANENTVVSVLSRQSVPVDRLFMTYVETEAMNRQFLEAEAILLADPNATVF